MRSAAVSGTGASAVLATTRDGHRVLRQRRQGRAELIARAVVDEAVVVVDVVEGGPQRLAVGAAGAVGVVERLQRDLLEIGFGDRDGLAQHHRVGAAPHRARQHAEHGARRDRDDDDRDDELDQGRTTFAVAAHRQGASMNPLSARTVNVNGPTSMS